MSGLWQENLYNGLIEPNRNPSPVYTGSLTKPNTQHQLIEMLTPNEPIISDNIQHRGYKAKHKKSTFTHRQMQFLQ